MKSELALRQKQVNLTIDGHVADAMPAGIQDQ